MVYRVRKIKIKTKNGDISEEEKVEHYPPELLKPTGLTD